MSSLYLTKVVPNSVVLRPPNPLESTIDLTPGPGRSAPAAKPRVMVLIFRFIARSHSLPWPPWPIFFSNRND